MIELKPFGEEDFEKLISWVDSKELLLQFAGYVFEYPLTEEQLVAYISDEKRHAFKVVNPQTNETIGHAEIYLLEPKVALLCRILIGKEEYRGKGLGQQIMHQLIASAFEMPDVEMAELNVFDWNTPAIKCYEKTGFRINPDKIKTAEVNGAIWTAINMTLRKTN